MAIQRDRHVPNRGRSGSKNMREEKTTIIESVFHLNDGDGDFLSPAHALPFEVIAPNSRDGVVLFARKTQLLLSAIAKEGKGEQVGFVGRAALPSANDVEWLRDFVDDRPLIFLGDCDPPDLMSYFWLALNLSSANIKFAGISDYYLKRIGFSNGDRSWEIPMNVHEVAAVSLLDKEFPEYRTLIGPRCSALIEEGHKIELEAVASSCGRILPLWSL